MYDMLFLNVSLSAVRCSKCFWAISDGKWACVITW